MDPKRNIPTIFVIFGATGDLTKKRLAPALFHLFEKNLLPDMFKIIGFAGSEISSENFKNYIEKSLLEHKDFLNKREKIKSFLDFFSFQQGSFEKSEDYYYLAKAIKKIDDKWSICSNKLFYLAVAPNFYESILKNLASSGLTKACSPEEGWTRVIVEKPFGKDLNTARKLDKLLEKLFKEVQIYRIDHYLGKETVQNILSFRFANNLFEKSWNSQLVERIEIKLLEDIGIEGRGSFYDSLGALRDVGQNHLLQMLALVVMDSPEEFTSETIRKKRAEAIKKLVNISKEKVSVNTFRAQYEEYKNIQGVDENSQTETYFKIKAFLSGKRWKGVPVFLESGKKLGIRQKEISVIFKQPSICFCAPGTENRHKNKITFRIEPTKGITVYFWVKKPGLTMETEEKKLEFDFSFLQEGTEFTEEYERLIMDCIMGDQMLFVSSKEINAMWKFIDPIVEAWQKDKVDLIKYTSNSLNILEKSKIIEK